MKFNLTYGPDIASAPDGFKATVEAVAAFFESTFTDPVTINVKVERGLSGGLLGHSDYALTGPYTFAQITTALAHGPQSGSDAIAVANLPAVDPISGTHAYYMTSAQAKALGLMGPSDALDGTVQFANNPPFDYDRSDGISPGSYDFYGSVAHEFSEVMGRELNAIGNEVQTGEPHGYYPFDLFKYSAAGVRSFVGTEHGLFLAGRRRHQPRQLQRRFGRRLRRLGRERRQRRFSRLQRLRRRERGHGDRHRGDGRDRLGRRARQPRPRRPVRPGRRRRHPRRGRRTAGPADQPAPGDRGRHRRPAGPRPFVPRR